jgi:integrase
MSVRKRLWFTNTQINEKAKQIALHDAKSGEPWRDYVSAARQHLNACLAAGNDRAASATDRERAQLELKQFPPREAWIVAYSAFDPKKGDGEFRTFIKTFKRKKEADAFAATATVEVRDGTHVPDSASVTVKDAGALWLETAEKAGLERTTLDQYRQHLKLHIEPLIGRMLLSRLNAPTVRKFEDQLRDAGRSPTLTRYIVRSLGALLADAQERGLVVRNTVRELRGRRRRGKDGRQEARAGNLKIGVDIPTPAEIRAMIKALDRSRWRPLLLTAIFTGLRASELRGLKWADVDLKKREIHVRQRADRYNKIGKLKSAAGERTVPIPEDLAIALREWKIACPKNEHDLAFPNSEGKIEFHSNIVQRGLGPIEIAAGVTVCALDEAGKPKLDKDGRRIVEPKYPGLHSLRHFYASWCINRKADGGLELPAKVVQHRLGHSSITVTLDTYGHLFPRGDDGAELAEAARALMG